MNPSQAQELVQSQLPSEAAWGANLSLYHGFWFYPKHLEGLLLAQNNFQATDTDLLLLTTFKSGTTWLKALLFAVTKRSQYPTDDPNHPLLSSNPHELVPFLEDSGNLSSHVTCPRLLSTHSPYNLLPESVKTTKCRIIYLCRDPKDVFISVWHFMKETMMVPSDHGYNQYSIPLGEAFELFCKGISPLGPIWDHALDYWNMSLKEPEKVLFIKYSDLKGDTVSQVKKMAEFVGFPFSAEEESQGIIQEIAKMCSFDNLSNLDVNKNEVGYGTGNLDEGTVTRVGNKHFFRKGEVGDWKNYITPSMREQFDQVTQQKLLGSTLKFD